MLELIKIDFFELIIHSNKVIAKNVVVARLLLKSYFN